MSIRATGTFEVKTWDEKPYEEIDGGAKLTRASVTQSFHGDIEGEGAVEYLMMYPDESSARFVGLQRVVGRIGSRSGSFVLQLGGTFEEGTAKATWSVVPAASSSIVISAVAEARPPSQPRVAMERMKTPGSA